MQGAFRFLLDMLEEKERYNFMMSLQQSEEGSRFVCSYVAKSDTIDDIAFEIYSNCALRLDRPYYSDLGDAGQKRPLDCILLAERILQKHPEDKSFITIFSSAILGISEIPTIYSSD